MFFLVPLGLSLGAYYVAYTIGDNAGGMLFAIIGVTLMAFAMLIAKIEFDMRCRDRHEIDRLRQEEADINELLNDTSDFLREFEANEAHAARSTRYEGDRA